MPVHRVGPEQTRAAVSAPSPGAGDPEPQISGVLTDRGRREHGAVRRIQTDDLRVRLSGLATAGLDLDDFASGVLDLLARAVPHDVACLATMDPATEMVTRTFKVNLPDHL